MAWSGEMYQNNTPFNLAASRVLKGLGWFAIVSVYLGWVLMLSAGMAVGIKFLL